MPVYTYRCNGPVMHTFDQRGGYDDEEVLCSFAVPPSGKHWVVDCDYFGCRACELGEGTPCGHEAHRRPYYEDTAVSFQGTGFTQTIVPPAKPQAGTIKGEPTQDWFEKLDRHAERVYKDDENVEPYRKKQAKKMLKQVDKGGIV